MISNGPPQTHSGRQLILLKADGSLLIHQDARIYLSSLDDGKHVTHTIPAGRHAWLQVLRGGVNVNGHQLGTSDGAAVSDPGDLQIVATQPAEVMLFDLN